VAQFEISFIKFIFLSTFHYDDVFECSRTSAAPWLAGLRSPPDGTFGVTSFTDRGGTFDLFMQLRVHVGDQAAPTDLILGAQPRVTISLHSASANRRTQQEENRNMITVDARTKW
jgi:hypothetical protein